MEGEELKLGIHQVKEIVINFCQSPDGKNALSNAAFLSDFDLLNKIHKQTKELQKLISNPYPPFPKLDNVNSALEQIKISGSAISVENLGMLRKWLQTGLDWVGFLEKNAENELKILVNHTFVSGDALRKINAIIDIDGNFKEDASPLLHKISSDLKNLDKKQQNLLDRIYKDAVKKGYVPEGGSISVKNGRTVIPVLSRHKRNMGGILQDESASGSVLFFEPSESVEVSNLILEKENERKREIHRILLEISTYLNNDFAGLKRLRKFIELLDQILAKVKFANTYDLTIPQLHNSSSSKIFEGYHPILKWNFDKQGKTTEPLTLDFDAYNRIVLISGPNAGGKSVSLKTVGILQYMVQLGLPVPAHETSIFGIFKKVFVVIGDEQSLENDLSTYSSHLLNLKRVLKKANENSLVLIDEFGSGTEPVIGGAIAEAILRKLIVTNAKCLITTHYLNLKEFADREKGIKNASMRFDMNKLEPLYKLEVGKPGGSFALEMMQKVGISHDIIADAKKIAGEEVIGIEKLLAKVQRQKKNLETRESNIKHLEKELTIKNQKLETLQNKLDKQKDQIIKKAEETAKGLLKDANKEIEKTIRHIKESKANKNETRKVRSSFNKFRDKVSAEPNEEKKVVSIDNNQELKKGDHAIIKGQSHPGIIEEIKGKKVTLVVNGVSLKVDKDKLEKVSGKVARQQTRKSNQNIDTTSRRASFSPYLDVRGLRGEEAITLVDKFLDDAILVGEGNLTILHGKGDGILKDLVRNQLRKLKYIESFRDGDADRGGAGLTIIQLK